MLSCRAHEDVIQKSCFLSSCALISCPLFMTSKVGFTERTFLGERGYFLTMHACTAVWDAQPVLPAVLALAVLA